MSSQRERHPEAAFLCRGGVATLVNEILPDNYIRLKRETSAVPLRAVGHLVDHASNFYLPLLLAGSN